MLFCVVLAGCARPEPAPNADSVAPRADSISPSSPGRLPPSAFQVLGAELRARLEQRRCAIPQTFADSAPHNVIRGRFSDSVRTDIAVLCLAGSTSSIIVFRGSDPDSIVEIAKQHHAPAELTMTGEWTFGRAIETVDATYIRTRYERYGGPKPPALNHQGINDIVVGKASAVWYWHSGQWLRLQGAD